MIGLATLGSVDLAPSLLELALIVLVLIWHFFEAGR